MEMGCGSGSRERRNRQVQLPATDPASSLAQGWQPTEAEGSTLPPLPATTPLHRSPSLPPNDHDLLPEPPNLNFRSSP